MIFVGPGGTGKTQITLLLTALMGKEATVTTSLKGLHSDAFEVANLRGKKLILISEAGAYKGEANILKLITGDDALKCREKYVQKSEDLVPEGRVVMTSNDLIEVYDTTYAVSRRMKVFLADNVSKNKRPLIYYTQKGWQSPLSKEFAGIFNWAISQDISEALDCIEFAEIRVPSLAQHIEEARHAINPIEAWIIEELQEGEGSYVGYLSQESSARALRDVAERKSLFPTYLGWCRRNRVGKISSHKKFTEDVLFALNYLGFKVKKIRKSFGYYIVGVIVKDYIYDKNYREGAPIVYDEKVGGDVIDVQIVEETLQNVNSPKETEVVDITSSSVNSTKIQEQVEDTGFIKSSPINSTKSNHTKGSNSSDAYHKALYDRYFKCLGKTSLKEQLNRYIKKALRQDRDALDRCIDMYKKDLKIGSIDSLLLAQYVIGLGLDKIIKFGCIPYTYRLMGNSPRIIPVMYGNSINNTKRVVRKTCYKMLGAFVNQGLAQNMFNDEAVILDLDLVSCYTSILINLYPERLEGLQKAIERGELWKFIETEFEEEGCLEAYDKSAVKTCVYCSLYGGGEKAMLKAIMDAYRNDLGQTQAEFQTSEYYDECQRRATDVVRQMNRSKIVQDFRDISEYVHELYKYRDLIGPTKHKYPVSNSFHAFKTSFANFLASYEFALIANTVLNVVKNYPKIEVIGHYHDGVVVVVPWDQKEEIVKAFNDEIGEVGYDLCLAYKQSIECKNVHPAYYPNKPV